EVIGAEGEKLTKFRDRIEDDREGQSKRFKSFKDDVAEAIDERRWYVNSGAWGLAAAAGVFAVAGVLPFWIGVDGFRSAAPRWSDIVLIALGACAIANAVL